MKFIKNGRYFSVSAAPVKNEFFISLVPILSKNKNIKQNNVAALLRCYVIYVITLLRYLRYYVTTRITRRTSRVTVFGAVGRARLKFLARYSSFLTGAALTKKYIIFVSIAICGKKEQLSYQASNIIREALP